MARKKSDRRAHSALQVERAPTDPTLDPVLDEPVDAPADASEVVGSAASTDASVVAQLEAPATPLDPLAPVRVRNLGSRVWGGSDYAAVGTHSIPAGGVGVVTRKKAEDLVAGRYAGAPHGVGPFEIVEE